MHLCTVEVRRGLTFKDKLRVTAGCTVGVRLGNLVLKGGQG